MNRATWYVLEDGAIVSPQEVAPNAEGRLAHKSGLVAMRDDGETPLSRGIDLGDNGKPYFGGKGDHDGNGTVGGSKPKTADMTPEETPAPAKRAGYKTRGK